MPVRLAFAAVVLSWLWTVAAVDAVVVATISGAVAYWYSTVCPLPGAEAEEEWRGMNTRGGLLPKLPVGLSLWRVVRYHAGSILLGALPNSSRVILAFVAAR